MEQNTAPQPNFNWLYLEYNVECRVKHGLEFKNLVEHSILQSHPTYGVECCLEWINPHSKINCWIGWVDCTPKLWRIGVWIALQKNRSAKSPAPWSKYRSTLN